MVALRILPWSESQPMTHLGSHDGHKLERHSKKIHLQQRVGDWSKILIENCQR